ncbi:hypothetical protein [Latilactobacillus fuchuensis]|uniref:hypothetical protein n=1 Tax=Latilactobacillus fuchuensis TaxID=164393 RepID=UPI0020C7DF01|nr:hypothetical protein [Latilactobacillus fuchuensis]MCP8858314.1 hypothetical protein [Latilactobacillus fuchuensis]
MGLKPNQLKQQISLLEEQAIECANQQQLDEAKLDWYQRESNQVLGQMHQIACAKMRNLEGSADVLPRINQIVEHSNDDMVKTVRDTKTQLAESNAQQIQADQKRLTELVEQLRVARGNGDD